LGHGNAGFKLDAKWGGTKTKRADFKHGTEFDATKFA
jgi:hypothetical protein